MVTVGNGRPANPSKIPSGSDAIVFNDKSLPISKFVSTGSEHVNWTYNTHMKMTPARRPRNIPLGSEEISFDWKMSCCKFGVLSNKPSGRARTPLAVMSRDCSLVLFSNNRSGRLGTPVVCHFASLRPFNRLERWNSSMTTRVDGKQRRQRQPYTTRSLKLSPNVVSGKTVKFAPVKYLECIKRWWESGAMTRTVAILSQTNGQNTGKSTYMISSALYGNSSSPYNKDIGCPVRSMMETV